MTLYNRNHVYFFTQCPYFQHLDFHLFQCDICPLLCIGHKSKQTKKFKLKENVSNTWKKCLRGQAYFISFFFAVFLVTLLTKTFLTTTTLFSSEKIILFQPSSILNFTLLQKIFCFQKKNGWLNLILISIQPLFKFALAIKEKCLRAVQFCVNFSCSFQGVPI